MKPSNTLNTHLQAVVDAVSKRKAPNVRVFGSIARGTDTEESDIDLLVDALPGAAVELVDNLCGLRALNLLRRRSRPELKRLLQERLETAIRSGEVEELVT